MRLLVALPIGNGLCLLIQADIALVAGGLEFSLSQSLKDHTALFFDMGAVLETALIQIGGEFGETALKDFLAHQLHLVDVKGRKTGGICDQRIANAEQFHVSGGVTTAAELFADIAGCLFFSTSHKSKSLNRAEMP